MNSSPSLLFPLTISVRLSFLCIHGLISILVSTLTLSLPPSPFLPLLPSASFFSLKECCFMLEQFIIRLTGPCTDVSCTFHYHSSYTYSCSLYAFTRHLSLLFKFPLPLSPTSLVLVHSLAVCPHHKYCLFIYSSLSLSLSLFCRLNKRQHWLH